MLHGVRKRLKRALTLARQWEAGHFYIDPLSWYARSLMPRFLTMYEVCAYSNNFTNGRISLPMLLSNPMPCSEKAPPALRTVKHCFALP